MRISDWSSDVCSSDLNSELATAIGIFAERILHRPAHDRVAQQRNIDHDPDAQGRANNADHGRIFAHDRSEEHTSELQSLMRISYAVFCLKKKKTQITHRTTTNNSIKRNTSQHTQ